MTSTLPRTKIVATLGPASHSPETIRDMVRAGMRVARLNFSHGDYAEHARLIGSLRQISAELHTPVTILQDLQGPKIRVGRLVAEPMALVEGARVLLVPAADDAGQGDQIPVDYPNLAADVKPGDRALLDDGLLELAVEEVQGAEVACRVVVGGALKSRKGVVFPDVDLAIPSITAKDKRDLDFGIRQNVDWIALSFVRAADDVRALKELLATKGAQIPVVAKIEKPQAIRNLDAILDEVEGLMVARGDLGVELSPEKVPIVQKRIIRACNARGLPVITATQMLESMIREPRPTRAEASDVANAIIDGSDCVMLSGETAVGAHPVHAVEMMARIAREVEPKTEFQVHRPFKNEKTYAIAQAIWAIDQTMAPKCILSFTTSGYTPRLLSSRRLTSPVVAVTPVLKTFHALNLFWGVQPVLVDRKAESFEDMISLAESAIHAEELADPGDEVPIVAGLPMGLTGNSNIIKVHVVSPT